MRSFAAGINHPLASLSEEMEDGKNNPFVFFPSSGENYIARGGVVARGAAGAQSFRAGPFF